MIRWPMLLACTACAATPDAIMYSDARHPSSASLRAGAAGSASPSLLPEPLAVKLAEATVSEVALANGIRLFVRQRVGALAEHAYLVIHSDFATSPVKGLMSRAYAYTLLSALGYPELVRLGATLRLGWGHDWVTFDVTHMPSSLPDVLSMYSKSFANPQFEHADLDWIKQRWLAGAERNAFNASAIAYRHLAFLVTGERSRLQVLPSDADDLMALQASDLGRFHSSLNPRDLVFVFDGPLSAQECFASSQQSLAKLSFRAAKPSVAAEPSLPAKHPAKSGVAFIERKGSPGAEILVGYLLPAFSTGTFVHGELLAASLSRGLGGTLFDVLRQHNGDAYGVSVRQSAGTGGGMLVIATTVAGARAASTLKSIQEATVGLGTSLDEPTFTRAKNSVEAMLQSPAPEMNDRGVLHTLAARGVSLSALNTMRTQAEETTPESLKAFARSHLDASRRHVVIVGEASVRESLVREGFTIDLVSKEVY
jgi:predicted Zn-dependent peptidase